jgi:hypothetical protein
METRTGIYSVFPGEIFTDVSTGEINFHPFGTDILTMPSMGCPLLLVIFRILKYVESGLCSTFSFTNSRNTILPEFDSALGAAAGGFTGTGFFLVVSGTDAGAGAGLTTVSFLGSESVWANELLFSNAQEIITPIKQYKMYDKNLFTIIYYCINKVNTISSE